MVLLAALAMAMAVAGPGSAEATGASVRASAAGRLQIYYRSPVLVRTGERVRIPVDVACATATGRPCRATVALGTAGPSGRWRELATRARPEVRFDITAPTIRAARTRGQGAVSYSLSARGAGRRVTFPAAGRGALRLYATRHMRKVLLPSVPFGGTRTAHTALFLPWGTGPRRAGLSPGGESVTVGPPAFDVDRRGRIYVLDALQRRVALFRDGRFLRQFRLSLTSQADLSVAADGTIYVAAQSSGRIRAESLARDGHVSHRWDLGRGILAEVRAEGGAGFVHVLPLDAWIRLGSKRSPVQAGPRQPSGSLLLSSVVGNTIRLGLARGSRVQGAVELRPRASLGELALATSYGVGGYLAVFRVVRDGPRSAEQFQAVRLDAEGHIDTFGIRDESFADTLAYSRFRLGGDGNLYQLATFPDGMRILRFDMGEGS